jgi:hypothetical protein
MTNIQAVIETMRRLIMLTGMATLALSTSVNAATLNKCIDAQGKVTYSNLPCRNAREAHTLEIDPAPSPDPGRSAPSRAQPANQAPKPAAGPNEHATIQLETQRTTGKPATRASASQCDAITDKLGRVLDKMDLARRKGYTQKQMDKWDQEIKDLQRKKQQSSCF